MNRSIRVALTFVAGLVLALPTGTFPVAAQPLATPACVPPPAGLVSWWSANGTANDVQTLNNGTLLNGATFAPGKVGQAFSFDGVDDVVRIPSAPNLNPPGSFTIEGWISPTLDTLGVILAKWGDSFDWAGQRAYSFSTDQNLTLSFAISDAAHQNDAAFHTFRTPNNAIQLKIWNYVTAVYDQSTGTRTIYVNGVLAATRTDGPITVLPSVADAGIGAHLSSSTTINQPFQGLIDEVSIYDRALSQPEIQAIYSAGSAGKCLPSIFVASIDPSYTTIGGSFNVTGSVTIHDTNGTPISNATVVLKVAEPNRVRVNFALTTDSTGVASTSFLSSLTGTYTFTVTRVSLKGRTYDPSLNVETRDTLTIP